MTNTLATLSDGTDIKFCSGKFDNFLVKVTRPDGSVYCPKDTEFFTDVMNMVSKYGREAVWFLILGISSSITRYTRLSDFTIPLFLSDDERAIIAYMIAAMIAEELKANAVIGKRMKLLGLYQVMYADLSIEEASNWSRGKKWREIDEELKKYKL